MSVFSLICIIGVSCLIMLAIVNNRGEYALKPRIERVRERIRENEVEIIRTCLSKCEDKTKFQCLLIMEELIGNSKCRSEFEILDRLATKVGDMRDGDFKKLFLGVNK